MTRVMARTTMMAWMSRTGQDESADVGDKNDGDTDGVPNHDDDMDDGSNLSTAQDGVYDRNIDDDDFALIKALIEYLANWFYGCEVRHLLDHCEATQARFHGTGRNGRFKKWVERYSAYFIIEDYKASWAVKNTGKYPESNDDDTGDGPNQGNRISHDDYDLISSLIEYLNDSDKYWPGGCELNYVRENCSVIQKAFNNRRHTARFLKWIAEFPSFFEIHRKGGKMMVKWKGSYPEVPDVE